MLNYQERTKTEVAKYITDYLKGKGLDAKELDTSSLWNISFIVKGNRNCIDRTVADLELAKDPETGRQLEQKTTFKNREGNYHFKILRIEPELSEDPNPNYRAKIRANKTVTIDLYFRKS